jgi:elongation factor G
MSSSTGIALLSITVGPKTLDDAQRLARGLAQLLAEDSALRAMSDQVTGDVVIAGVSELHLEIVLDRLKREFNVEAVVSRPRVACKETVTRPADGEAKYVSQDRQYAHVKIRLLPGDDGTGYVFEDHTTGGAVPSTFITSIDEGIREALTHGVVAGFPVDDVRIELYDGSYHDVDSSEAAFRAAGSLAFDDAAKKADPVLLEPVMRVEVVVPEEHVGVVMGNLSGRRGVIQAMEIRVGTRCIIAHVPLSEMSGYSTDLRSRTQGRGTYTMQFERYQPFRRPERDAEGQGSFVREPRGPLPKPRNTGIALPEPDDDRLET